MLTGTFRTTNPSHKIFQFFPKLHHGGPSRDYSRVTDAFDQLVKKARIVVESGSKTNMSHEKTLVRVYRGLYYPVIWGLINYYKDPY